VSRLKALASALLVLAVSIPVQVEAQGRRSLPDTATGVCGRLENPYGPFDFRTTPFPKRDIVERYHFTTEVATLQRGVSGSIGGDIDYTLRAFPNHPRALHSMALYGRQLGTTHVPRANWPVECYFERAIRFAPDDPQVRALYADYLIHLKRPQDAKRQLETAERFELSPTVAYNLGLAWAELKEYDKARELARRAYAGGIEFTGLRDRLKAAGAWKE
jgi:tetratricopeptide (TPR) repeat protein